MNSLRVDVYPVGFHVPQFKSSMKSGLHLAMSGRRLKIQHATVVVHYVQ
jgi:hypothetical protein